MAALIFRCDENAETGLGHFARCRDLARLLRQERPELRLVFAGDLSSYAEQSLAELGFESLQMAPGEALVPARLSAAADPDARLLIDSYRLDQATLTALGGWAAAWGVFDDFGSFDYAAARLVINARIGARPEPYRAATLALGPSYFPVTPELALVRAERPTTPRKTPESVLVFIGGNDHFGVGPRVAEAAAEVFAESKVVCVQHRPLDLSHARVQARPLGQDLSLELGRADLVLAGGGRLKYEAAYCLVPCASLSQTTGQAEDTAELAAQGICLDLGLAERFDAAQARARLAELWRPEALLVMRAAQARALPVDAGARLARAVLTALELA